jgi:hypothetical protein
MLKVTDEALALLARLLEERNTPAGMAARFVFDRDNLTVEVDALRSGDAPFYHKDRVVLLLDKEAANMLSRKTLYVEETEDGPKLALMLYARKPRRKRQEPR